MTPGIDYEGAVDEYPELVGEYAHAFRNWWLEQIMLAWKDQT